MAPFFLPYSYHSYQPGLPLLPLQDATLDRNLFNSTKHFSTQKTVEEKTKTMANIDRIHQISEFDPTTINFGHPSATSYCSDAEISTYPKAALYKYQLQWCWNKHYAAKSAAVLRQRYTNTHCSKAEISTYTTESSAVTKQPYTSTYCSGAEISTMLQRAQAALKQHYTNTHCRKAEMSTYATESSAVPKQLHASTYCSRAEISTMWQRALLAQSSAIQAHIVVVLKWALYYRMCCCPKAALYKYLLPALLPQNSTMKTFNE